MSDRDGRNELAAGSEPSHRFRDSVFLCLVFVLALYHFLLWRLGPRLSELPGGLGDARLANYLLEHGYRSWSGEDSSFWDAPFFYPQKNVTALSDNHLGALPFYSVFRILGCDRHDPITRRGSMKFRHALRGCCGAIASLHYCVTDDKIASCTGECPPGRLVATPRGSLDRQLVEGQSARLFERVKG